MSTIDQITEELILNAAANSSAVTNAKKISQKNGFTKLCRSADNTLVFGECSGSGKNPYYASADFSGDSPVYRCSCPSRQIPCKHCLALMFDYISKKDKFTVEDVPEDITRKRQKIAKRAETAASSEKAVKKTNPAAAAKKLKKQREGLLLAKDFVNDILTRGVSAVNPASAAQYSSLAKQMGDYYLYEPQAIMNEIVKKANLLSEQPNDNETNSITSLCIKLASSIKKSIAYIDEKLEKGEVLPEDTILYEAMGNVWKLTQLKEIGLYKENASILQLSFAVIDDDIHKALVDTAYWIDIETGEISRTENIRPIKALSHIKSQDSAFDLYKIKELYRYPGGLNRRIRWEAAEAEKITDNKIFEEIISLAEKSLSESVKKAKNELKNTMSEKFTALLTAFDSIEFTQNNQPVLKSGEETILLQSNENYPETCEVLKLLNNNYLQNGALLGEFSYNPNNRKICLCPISIVVGTGIVRLV